MLITNQISLIFMSDKDFLIGLNDQQPYYIKEDLAYFQKVTKDAIVVMGRKTYEDIIRVTGKPLKNRLNIILSDDMNYVPQGVDPTDENTHVRVVHSKVGVLAFYNTYKLPMYVIGGAKVFSQFEDLASAIYHTQVHDVVLADELDDCVFYEPDFSKFRLDTTSEVKSFEHNGKTIEYEHKFYVRSIY